MIEEDWVRPDASSKEMVEKGVMTSTLLFLFSDRTSNKKKYINIIINIFFDQLYKQKKDIMLRSKLFKNKLNVNINGKDKLYGTRNIE